MAPSQAAEATAIHLVTILSTRVTPGSYPVVMRHIDFEVTKSLKGATPTTRSLSFWVDTNKSWAPSRGDAAILVLSGAPTERHAATLLPSTPKNLEVAAGAPPMDEEPVALLTTRTGRGGCSTENRRQSTGPVGLRSAPDVSGELRVWVTNYDYYCSPAPSFVASASSKGEITIEESPLLADARVTRCTCHHDVVFTIEGVRAGEHEVILLPRDQEGSSDPLAKTNLRMP